MTAAEERTVLITALRTLADAVTVYGVTRSAEDERWIDGLNGVLAAIQQARTVLADVER